MKNYIQISGKNIYKYKDVGEGAGRWQTVGKRLANDWQKIGRGRGFGKRLANGGQAIGKRWQEQGR